MTRTKGSGKATRYYTADGTYLPGANDPALQARKEALFTRLDNVYDRLNKFQDTHNATKYGCLRSGTCCRVGLVLHTLELENMARHLKASFDEKPSEKARVVEALKATLVDEKWTMNEGVGDLMCAFYENGCTVYPFRPAVCRMYGVILELNDDCPRRRLASGREFVWIHPEADATVKQLYSAVDEYGKMFPRADCSRYLGAGLLMLLLPRKELTRIRSRTPQKFWRTMHGYRSQFVPSRKQEPYTEKVPRFPLRVLSRSA